MRSQFKTLLSLTEFADIHGLHHWLMAQYGWISSGPPPIYWRRFDAQCDDCIFEYERQNKGFSRYELSRAIHQAEETFAREWGYYPAPKCIEGEEILFPEQAVRGIRASRAFAHTGYSPVQGRPLVQLKHRYVQGFGACVLTEVSDGELVEYNDIDGDGVEEEWELSLPLPVPAGTTADQIRVFFTDVDRGAFMPRDEWEIRPVYVTVDNVPDPPEVMIRGHSWCMLPPDMAVSEQPDCVTADEEANFVTSVAVYIETLDADDQGLIAWADDCATPTLPACFNSIHQRKGVVYPQALACDDADPPVCTPIDFPHVCGINNGAMPERIFINYQAGYPRQANGRMDLWHAQLISWMAAAYLKCKPCGCSCKGNEHPLDWYSKVATQALGRDEGFVWSEKLMSNRLGPWNGTVMAWVQAQRMSEKIKAFTL